MVRKYLAVVVPFSILGFIGIMLGWAEMGYIHQTLHHWTTVVSNDHVQKSIMTGTSKHSMDSEVALGSFFGVIFILLSVLALLCCVITWEDTW